MRIASIFPIGGGVYQPLQLVVIVVGSKVVDVEVSVDKLDLVELFGPTGLVLPRVESPKETQEGYQIFLSGFEKTTLRPPS